MATAGFPTGRMVVFDYYNAWGIYYELFWIDQVDGSFDPNFIVSALGQYAKHLVYLVGPKGVPILGRSICYRMAITAPLILDQEFDRPLVDPGEARRALRLTWGFFIKNEGVTHGNITQGYCAADRKVLDSYSGPASCLWGLRSLISALYLPPSSKFWTEDETLLPVERSSYLVNFPQPGWRVRGTKPDLIVIVKDSGKHSFPLEDEQPFLVVADRLTGRVHRPDNEGAKYGLSEYRSDLPFCGCASDVSQER